MIIKNAFVLNDEFHFVHADVYTDGRIITAIRMAGTAGAAEEPEQEIIDAYGSYLIPGLIDIHSHGAVGCDHLDGAIESTSAICQYMAAKGTTSILATIMTQSCEKMENACRNVAEYNGMLRDGAHVRGIYLEGPFFTEKYKGAQHPDYLMDANIDFFKKMYTLSGGLIKIISLSPERQGSEEFTKEVLSDKDFSPMRVFIGHTNSDFDTANSVIEAGASGLTHTFNGMRPLHHRNPGVLAACLNNSKVFCECICDGIHVHPAMIKFLYDHIGRDRFVIVSDSIQPAGLEDGKYTSGGQEVTVKNNIAYLGLPGDSIQNSTIAGSTACLYDSVMNLVRWDIATLEDSVYAASAMPAKAAGIYDHVGSISVGKAADLLIVSKNLELNHVIISK